MPFTPFHMGPGLAIKAVAPRRFSVLMFGLAQVAIDLEPGLGLILGWDRLHGWTHTYLGAAVIALAVLAAGRPVALWILRRWNAGLRGQGAAWLADPDELGWAAAATGAFVGTFSHVALDSLMHADMRPLAPWSGANPWLAAISLSTLHMACLALGAVGLLLWLLRKAAARANVDKLRL